MDQVRNISYSISSLVLQVFIPDVNMIEML